MKKMLWVMLILALVIPGLVFGSGSAESDVSANDEVVELTFSAMTFGTTFEGFQDDAVIKEIEEKLNVRLNIIPENAVGDAVGKFTAQLAANEFADIVFVPYQLNLSEIMPKLVSSGVMLPLDELVQEYGPDISENMPAMLDASRSNYSIDVDGNNDGNLYFINLNPDPPSLGAELDVAPRLRYDLWAELGYPELNTIYDYIPVLKDMMELEPENKNGQKNYGVSGWFANNGGWGAWFFDAFAFMMGERGIGAAGYTDIKSGVYRSKFDDDDSFFWESIRWYNKANQAGILDPDAFTNKFPDFKEKVAGANRVFLGWADWNINNGNAAFVADGQENKGFVQMPSAYPERDYAVFTFYHGDGRRPIFISNKCENPEKAMEVLNYLCSIEGTRLLLNGIEGVHWDVVDGTPKVKDEVIESFKSDPDYPLVSGFQKYANMAGRGTGLIDPEYNIAIEYMSHPEVVKDNLIQVKLDSLEHFNVDLPIDLYEQKKYVNLNLSALSNIKVPEELKPIDTKIKNYVFTDIYKLILADSDEQFLELKEDFINTVNGMGAGQLHDFYKSQEYRIKEAVANSMRVQ